MGAGGGVGGEEEPCIYTLCSFLSCLQSLFLNLKIETCRGFAVCACVCVCVCEREREGEID